MDRTMRNMDELAEGQGWLLEWSTIFRSESLDVHFEVGASVISPNTSAALT